MTAALSCGFGVDSAEAQETTLETLEHPSLKSPPPGSRAEPPDAKAGDFGGVGASRTETTSSGAGESTGLRRPLRARRRVSATGRSFNPRVSRSGRSIEALARRDDKNLRKLGQESAPWNRAVSSRETLGLPCWVG